MVEPLDVNIILRETCSKGVFELTGGDADAVNLLVLDAVVSNGTDFSFAFVPIDSDVDDVNSLAKEAAVGMELNIFLALVVFSLTDVVVNVETN